MAHVHEFDNSDWLSDPVDDGWEPADRDFDLLVTEMLRRIGESQSGMADRVFQASVAFLPQPVGVADGGPLRFVPAYRERFLVRRRVWGRVALAASVMLACVVGVKVCLPSHGVATTMAAVTDADWGTFHGSETGNRSVSPWLGASEIGAADDKPSDQLCRGGGAVCGIDARRRGEGRRARAQDRSFGAG
jgi:hypothetical protein